MKTPKLKSRSAITGEYVTAKAAKAKPATTVKSDDYPARQLRKLVRLWDTSNVVMNGTAFNNMDKLIANIKKRMGWK